jgi:hypothetical protein
VDVVWADATLTIGGKAAKVKRHDMSVRVQR